MTMIAAEQAKNEFESLLSRAARGEEFVITDRGSPVARLGPAGEPSVDKAAVSRTIEHMEGLRQGNRLGPDLTLRQLIEEGRRF